MRLYSLFHSQKGLVGLYLAIIVLMLSIGIASSVAFTIFAQLKIVRNNTASAQAYYAAESGVEDALLRLRKGLTVPAPGSYPTFAVGSAVAEPDISAIIGGARTVTVKGDDTNRIRRAEVVYEIDATGVGFFYGAQVGDGGLQLDNNSLVDGNIFSNGNIIGNTGSEEVTGTVQVAGVGGILQDVNTVGGDAFVDICDNSGVGGILHGSSNVGCTFTSFDSPYTPVAPIPLPISVSQIDEWKDKADDGGTIGTTTITTPTSLGPVKVVGDLTVDSTLTVTGTIWVTGNVHVDNSEIVQLDTGYGATSGVIVVEGTVVLDNGSISKGSGISGSYLMYVSTSPANPAISVNPGGTEADIVYTTDGWIDVFNTATLREVTGYGIHVHNTAEIRYETGLSSTLFTSGPGGGWIVNSWKEIE